MTLALHWHGHWQSVCLSGWSVLWWSQSVTWVSCLAAMQQRLASKASCCWLLMPLVLTPISSHSTLQGSHCDVDVPGLLLQDFCVQAPTSQPEGLTRRRLVGTCCYLCKKAKRNSCSRLMTGASLKPSPPQGFQRRPIRHTLLISPDQGGLQQGKHMYLPHEPYRSTQCAPSEFIAHLSRRGAIAAGKA